ncbi:MAG: hypothetical protein JJ992_09080, partial [Planctomycetes bacterium]|nr:hypothetical protein [Planctomycetota bacterium]
MEETIGWLLPILLAVSLGTAICSAADQRRIRTMCLLAMGGLLAGMSGRLLFRPAIHWSGPTLFALDSFHQLDFGLRLTWTRLPLLWVVWWWMTDGSSQSAGRPHARSRRQAALSCLLLMFLSDDLWLWYGALVTFSLLQQSLVVAGVSPDCRLTALRGSHWLGVLLLLVSVGILSFDFRWQTFSDVTQVLEKWEGFSPSQQAELTLAAALAAWAVLLTAAVFPISVLRIDRDDESGLEILSALVAGAICVQFAPLFAMLDVAAAHRSLLLLTILTATVCSWRQPTSRRVTRCLGVALIMLSLMGMLICGAGTPNQLARGLSLEHFTLVLILWSLWDRERLGRRQLIVACGFAVLLLAGFSSCLLSLSAGTGVEMFPGRLNWFIAAGLSAGLATWIATSFSKKSEDDRQESVSAPTGTESLVSGYEFRTACFAGCAVIVTTRLMLWNAGFSPGMIPSL